MPGAEVDFLAVDATVAADAARAEETARRRLGGIDVLVNATGRADRRSSLHHIPIKDMRARLDELILPRCT